MTRLALALAALVAFTAYTLTVAAQHSLLGFLSDHARGGWSLQVFLDLCVAGSAFWVIGVADARARGIRPWPYVVLTPPSLRSPPPGCRFHPRCGQVVDRCRAEEPALTALGDRRAAACHLAR